MVKKAFGHPLSWCVRALLGLPIGFFASQASAATESVSLTATGTIAAAPQWQDGAGADLTSIVFNFGNLVASQVAAVDVTSAAVSAKLVNAAAYPATVSLVRPSGCSIGTRNITQSHVHLMHNGSAITTDASFSIGSNANQTFALRYAAAGGYGTATGVVSCTTSGSLTYTY